MHEPKSSRFGRIRQPVPFLGVGKAGGGWYDASAICPPVGSSAMSELFVSGADAACLHSTVLR